MGRVARAAGLSRPRGGPGRYRAGLVAGAGVQRWLPLFHGHGGYPRGASNRDPPRQDDPTDADRPRRTRLCGARAGPLLRVGRRRGEEDIRVVRPLLLHDSAELPVPAHQHERIPTRSVDAYELPAPRVERDPQRRLLSEHPKVDLNIVYGEDVSPFSEAKALKMTP